MYEDIAIVKISVSKPGEAKLHWHRKFHLKEFSVNPNKPTPLGVGNTQGFFDDELIVNLDSG